MNPLEIHKHVAQSSGRKVGDVSPLSAELIQLAEEAKDISASSETQGPDSAWFEAVDRNLEIAVVEDVRDIALQRGIQTTLDSTDLADTKCLSLLGLAKLGSKDALDAVKQYIEDDDSLDLMGMVTVLTELAKVRGQEGQAAGIEQLIRLMSPNSFLDIIHAYQLIYSLVNSKEEQTRLLGIMLTKAADALPDAAPATRASIYSNIARTTRDHDVVMIAREEARKCPNRDTVLTYLCSMVKLDYSHDAAEEAMGVLTKRLEVEGTDAFPLTAVLTLNEAILENEGDSPSAQYLRELQTTPYTADHLTGDRAVYYAKLGDIGPAKKLLNDIHGKGARLDALMVVGLYTRDEGVIDDIEALVGLMAYEDYGDSFDNDALSASIKLAYLRQDPNALRACLDSIAAETGDYATEFYYTEVAAAAKGILEGKWPDEIPWRTEEQ